MYICNAACLSVSRVHRRPASCLDVPVSFVVTPPFADFLCLRGATPVRACVVPVSAYIKVADLSLCREWLLEACEAMLSAGTARDGLHNLLGCA